MRCDNGKGRRRRYPNGKRLRKPASAGRIAGVALVGPAGGQLQIFHGGDWWGKDSMQSYVRPSFHGNTVP